MSVPSSSHPPDLQAELDRLRDEVSALADANARAAELMVELDEARAVTAAVERRAEEIAFQHAIDVAVFEAEDKRALAEQVLAAVVDTAGLQVRAAVVWIGRGEGWVKAAHGEAEDIVAEVEGMADRRDEHPRAVAGRWYLLPLVAERFHGVLALGANPTPAWQERWGGLLTTSGRTVAAGVERRRLARERERMAKELAVARDEALAASQAKSSFLANMSHELRTPLNAIVGYSELLSEEAEDAPESMRRDLDRISSAARHLLMLINDILDLSRIEAGMMTTVVEPLHLPHVVAMVADTVRPLVEKNGNELRSTVVAGAESVTGDESKLRQVLVNLLSNAAKFTENGVVSLRVEPQEGDLIVYRVHDTGIGMTEEQLQRVFDDFTQADATTTRKYGGTGLGLAITRRLVAMLGGTIEVDSEPGRGTTFEVVLPRHAPSRD